MSDDYDWLIPAATGAAGALGGRMLGRSAARTATGAKAPKVGKAKGKSSNSISTKELRVRQAGTGGAIAGGLGGYKAGEFAQDPESVRGDINKAIAVRQGISDAADIPTDISGRALELAGAGMLAQGARKFVGNTRKMAKAAQKGTKASPEKWLSQQVKTIGPWAGGGGATLGLGAAVVENGRKRK